MVLRYGIALYLSRRSPNLPRVDFSDVFSPNACGLLELVFAWLVFCSLDGVMHKRQYFLMGVLSMSAQLAPYALFWLSYIVFRISCPPKLANTYTMMHGLAMLSGTLLWMGVTDLFNESAPPYWTTMTVLNGLLYVGDALLGRHQADPPPTVVIGGGESGSHVTRRDVILLSVITTYERYQKYAVSLFD